ncbi:MAG: zf-TFIIB domain-containing protein [Pseudomonadota bacterium]|uniref:TFIIB-type zinc ribbon-containing protein n=1 Tax=Thermithiobacillus tepidarius TaxID=929 RepID=UPI0004110519|nr:zf-TFIIB domain-containing protein [Thermithiobacillus tepidarius]
MKCPICNVELKLAERQGIEIDYCPQCRGVWLDRGELDKLIERSATTAAPQPQPSPYPPQHADSHYHHGGHYRKKKHKSFLGELFDFD